MTRGLSLAEAHHDGFERVRHHTANLVAFVRTLDETELATPLAHGDWTVGETVTHLRSVYERYTVDPRRAPTAEGVAQQNAEDILRIGIDAAGSATSIEQQIEFLAGVVDHIEPERTFPFHAGLETTLAGAWGNLLGELLAHGDDIATATGRALELPAGDDLEILWRFTAPLLAGWMIEGADGLDESWDLEFGFGTVRLTITHGGFRYGLDFGPRPRHYVLEIDNTVTWTLGIPYRRRSLADPDAKLLATRFIAF